MRTPDSTAKIERDALLAVIAWLITSYVYKSIVRKETELHVIWLDLTNAYGSVRHHLIRIALEFFNFPSKVGEIIMKYFNSAFMKFTVKNYTTNCQALEIGIMMGSVISSLLFVLAMELILRGESNTSKGAMENEHLTLPPSRAFMKDITILIPSQIAADGLLQRYYDLFTWARMKAKPKKSRSLSLAGGSAREFHFKIGGDMIPTIWEKLVKSLGRLYSITLIVIGVQRSRKQPWRGLNQLIKLVYPERWRLGVTNMVCYPVFCGPYRCTRLRYLVLNGSQSIATNTCVSGSEFLLVFWKWVYIPILETYSSQYPPW